MTIYGMKFVYGEIKLIECELRVSRCRAEAAGRERDLARKFAAGAVKRVKKDLTIVVDGFRAARCRAKAAVRKRNLARKFTAKKSVKEDSTDKVTNEVGMKVIHLDGVDQKNAVSMICRSLYIAGRFYDRLAGSGDFFIEYLEGHYSVKIFRDNKKRRWHIKGLRDNVLPFYTAIRELIAEWRRHEAVATNEWFTVMGGIIFNIAGRTCVLTFPVGSRREHASICHSQ